MWVSYPLMVFKKVSRSFSLSKKVDKSFNFSKFPKIHLSATVGTYSTPLKAGCDCPTLAHRGILVLERFVGLCAAPSGAPEGVRPSGAPRERNLPLATAHTHSHISTTRRGGARGRPGDPTPAPPPFFFLI